MVSSEPSLWTKNSSAFCFNRFGAVSILKFQQQKSPPQQPQHKKLIRPPMPSRKESSFDTSVSILTAAIAFAIYASTASDSIAGGDAGELVAEGCAL